MHAGRKRASPDVAKDSRKADTKRRKSSKGAKQQQKEEEDEEQQEEDAPASDADVDVAAAADADASKDGDADAGGINSCSMVLTSDSPCSDSPAWGVVSCMGRGVRKQTMHVLRHTTVSSLQAAVIPR